MSTPSSPLKRQSTLGGEIQLPDKDVDIILAQPVFGVPPINYELADDYHDPIKEFLKLKYNSKINSPIGYLYKDSSMDEQCLNAESPIKIRQNKKNAWYKVA